MMEILPKAAGGEEGEVFPRLQGATKEEFERKKTAGKERYLNVYPLLCLQNIPITLPPIDYHSGTTKSW